jgi:adenylate cyclase
LSGSVWNTRPSLPSPSLPPSIDGWFVLTGACIRAGSRVEADPQVSPTSEAPPPRLPVSPSSNSSNVSPRDHRMAGFGNHRRELAVLETSTPRIPSIQHNPPSAVQPPSNQIAPWMSANGRDVNSSPGFGAGYYDDFSTDPLSQPQHPSGLRGNASANHPHESDAFYDHERRPSAASAATVSSTGSRSSRGGSLQQNKKLQTFFGEDFPGQDASDTSLPNQGQETPREMPPGKDRSHSFARSQRERNLSSATDTTHRDTSPAGSRPRTPVPSSDVVPFLYQDSQVSNYQLWIFKIYPAGFAICPGTELRI